MKNQTILIVGGAGYIGTHVARKFLEAGNNVVIFDNFVAGYHQPLEILKQFGAVTVYEGDLQNRDDIQKVFVEQQINVVMHLAALLSVDESVRSPELYFKNNVLGTLNLLEAMRSADVKQLVFSSSCSVFGESQYLPIDEAHPLQPINPYGESKLMCEKMIKWYVAAHQFRAVVLRYFNVCGASSDGLIGDSKRPSPHLVQNLVLGAMKIKPFSLTCPKVDTPDGTPIRDYIDVEDLADAHFKAADFAVTHEGVEAFNLGNGSGYSVKEMLTKVEEIFQVTIESNSASSPRQGEYAAVYADPSKAKELLDWEVKKSLADSVLSLKKWYEQHPHGYEV